MKKKIIAGVITYLNAIIFYNELKRLSEIEFVEKDPARLNSLLRSGEIEISPSSSIEFAMRPRLYLVLPELSISSEREVKSVLLFSKQPLSALHKKKIAITSSSATSYVLLRIILEKFLSQKPEYLQTTANPEDALRSSEALLLIGDDALFYTKKINTPYIYDLGKLWYDLTGLPFVFALWILRRDSFNDKREGFNKIYNVLIEAKEKFKKGGGDIDGIPQLKWMTKQEIMNYLETISYDLTDRHIESVQKFYELARDIGVIPKAPLLSLADL